jgi:hypothetical protein
MPYIRPIGLHESQYSIGDKIVSFQQQLLLLRLAVVRTLENSVNYPDLFRALRVLIIDGERGRLGELSKLVNEDYFVKSRVLVGVESRNKTSSNKTEDIVIFPRDGLESLFLPNNHSSFFSLLGIKSDSDSHAINVNFWDYFESDVIGFMPEWGAEITRQRLIAEVCNTKDVVHATNNFPTFLFFTNAYGNIGPYFLEIAQDISYEVLKFGQKVLNICSEKYKEEISKALQLSIPIPSLICLFCQTPIAFDEFLCRNCNSLQLPAARRIGLVDQISSIFQYGRILKKPNGTLPIKFSRNTLSIDRISEFTFVDITDGNTRMLLRRLSDQKLIWLVEREAISLSAKWDLRETPDTNSIVFTFVWSPEHVKIISESKRGGLWEVCSDGIYSKLKLQPNTACT